VGGGARVAGEEQREYEVRLHPAAAREYRRLQGSVRERIRTAIDSLATVPRPAGVVKLAGRDDYRIRVGDYRVVYAVDDVERPVLVARIAHRREVYRR
jgi:mRNA interferase RelE/StbE